MSLKKHLTLTPCVTMTAHKNKARKVGGTITPLTQKRIRSFSMGISERKLWRNQYRKNESRPAEVMPAFAGRWFGKLIKLGQIASIILCRKAPAWTVRIAVHIIATKAGRLLVSKSRKSWWQRPTSNTNHGKTAIHAKDRPDYDRERYVVGCTHFPSSRNCERAN
jgi:hypothetical protein